MILPGRPVGGIGIPFRGFARFRVLDFSKLLPGPFASQILADMGMRVTRVEQPHAEDLMRGLEPRAFRMVNDGKRTVRLDLRKSAAKARLRRLLARADVLLETFRPGRMERMGLGFETVARLNPRLVYCSLSGYPADGPWARQAGHDLNFLARSGFVAAAGGRPAPPPAQVGDLSGSMAAVSGILAALLEREFTGRGRLVRMSMAQALHSWLVLPLANAGSGKGAKPWWLGELPYYRLYETRDRRWIAVAAVERPFWLALLERLGLSRLAALDARRDRARLSRALEAEFRKATSAQWARRLEGLDACVTPALSLPEAARSLSRSRSAGRA